MSLINREDLIAEYDRVHVGAPGGARKLMVDAPEVKPEQQWIPCSERLPEKEGNYLITAQPTYNHAKDIRIAHWSSRWVGYVKSEIIAWMPLPESYKERLEE